MKTTINTIRNAQLAISTLGFAIIPVDPTQEKIWCIRTRQDVPVDVIKQQAQRMIMEDPQSVVPKGNNDLGYAYMVQLQDNGQINVVALHNTKKGLRFRAIGFQGKTFYGITDDGHLVTSTQLKEAARKNSQNLVEFTKVTLRGLSRDGYITSLLATEHGKQTRLLIGVVTDRTQQWLYQGVIGAKDTELHLSPIEGQFQQVIGLRRTVDDSHVVLASADGNVWGAPDQQGQLNFSFLYGFQVNPIQDRQLAGGYSSDLQPPPPRASQPGRA